MTKCCLVFCVAFLAIGLSCDQVKQRLQTDANGKTVPSNEPTDALPDQNETPKPVTGTSGEERRGEVRQPTEHVVLKPASSAGPTPAAKPEHPPPLKIQAMELAAKELGMTLRLKEEQDPTEQARLEQEIGMLREQRQLLYQRQTERDQ